MPQPHIMVCSSLVSVKVNALDLVGVGVNQYTLDELTPKGRYLKYTGNTTEDAITVSSRNA